MIKKLDTLILRSFIGPFIITFFVAFFILMMQNLWKYVDDLVGKGLDFITICKFLWYASASMLMLAMPIAILISSIMTFGNMGEKFELVAIKSAGISLLRFMRPLVFFSFFLCTITFLFSNYVIPYANLKFLTLYSDIYVKKPAFDLKEGVFFRHIPNYAIKVGKKDADGQTIHNILIYEQSNFIQDNCIVAEHGKMSISEDQSYLEFNLDNGCRYEEKGNIIDTNTEFTRVEFTHFKKLFDLSSLKKNETNDSVFNKDCRMLSLRQLYHNLDSLKIEHQKNYASITKEININLPHTFEPTKNSISKQKTEYNKLIADSLKSTVQNIALSRLTSLKNNLDPFINKYNTLKTETRFDEIETNRKFSLSLSCMVLFFIGGPLGAIIRKGGLGMPLIVAIIFFMIFHLLMMFGEKFVNEEALSPFVGIWLPVLVLTPIGIFLTYKSMNDSQLFNKDFYKKLFIRYRKKNQ